MAPADSSSADLLLPLGDKEQPRIHCVAGSIADDYNSLYESGIPRVKRIARSLQLLPRTRQIRYLGAGTGAIRHLQCPRQRPRLRGSKNHVDGA